MLWDAEDGARILPERLGLEVLLLAVDAKYASSCLQRCCAIETVQEFQHAVGILYGQVRFSLVVDISEKGCGLLEVGFRQRHTPQDFPIHFFGFKLAFAMA